MSKNADTVRRIARIAVAIENRFGIPAELVFAQMALETGWLRHAPGNNAFGIKWNPERHGEKRQLLRTREYITAGQAKQWERRVPGRRIISELSQPDGSGKQWFLVEDWFAKYDSIEDCAMDYASLLTRRPRYMNAVMSSKDWREAAFAVAQSGYATDPDYASKLIRMIDKDVMDAINEARNELGSGSAAVSLS